MRDLDIPQGYETLRRLCEINQRIVSPNSFLLAAQQAIAIRLLQFCSTPEEARIAARQKALKYKKKLEKKGVETLTEGFDSDTVDQAEAAHLEFCNHQQGFEANAAYGFWSAEAAAKTAIVLKDDLVNHRLIGPGIKKLDPIIANRQAASGKDRNRTDALYAVHESIAAQGVERLAAGGRILVFPESTRSRNGDIKSFKPRIATPLIEHIQDSDNPTLAVKTAHVRGVFPHSVEDMAKFRERTPTNRLPLRFYLDLVDTAGRPPKEVLDEVRQIMKANLKNAITADLERLETAA